MYTPPYLSSSEPCLMWPCLRSDSVTKGSDFLLSGDGVRCLSSLVREVVSEERWILLLLLESFGVLFNRWVVLGLALVWGLLGRGPSFFCLRFSNLKRPFKNLYLKVCTRGGGGGGCWLRCGESVSSRVWLSCLTNCSHSWRRSFNNSLSLSTALICLSSCSLAMFCWWICSCSMTSRFSRITSLFFNNSSLSWSSCFVCAWSGV